MEQIIQETDKTFKLVKPLNDLKKTIKKEELVQKIATEVKKIAGLTTVTNPDLVQFIASLIENLVIKKYGFDKKEIFIKIYQEVFKNISQDDIENNIKTLEFLLQSKLIKKIPVLKHALHLSREILGIFFLNLKK